MRLYLRCVRSSVGATLLLASVAGAQADKPKTIELDNLRTPASPAFILLGVSPTAIARPSTPRALATELLSSSKNGTAIPNNYAVEFAPYWLTSHPTLSFKEYTEPTAAQSFRQSFSVSFATSRPDSASDTASTRIALGVRVQPVGGRPSSKFTRLTKMLDSIQRTTTGEGRRNGEAFDVDREQTDSLKARQARLKVAKTATDSAMLQASIAAATLLLLEAKQTLLSTDALLKTKVDTMRALALAMGQASADRVGTFVEVATAMVAAFPGSNFDAGRFSRLGLWATLGYRLEDPHLDVIGLARLIRDVSKVDQNAIDVGGRLLWMHEDLGLSAEWVNRTAFTVDSPQPVGSPRTVAFVSSNRLVGVADYRAGDNMYVTISFGQDHKSLGVDRHPLVATLGLQLLYGDKPAVKLP